MIDCNKAQYRTTSLDVFVASCRPETWKDFFNQEDVQNVITKTAKAMLKEAEYYVIQPPMPQMFRALELVAPANIKVVILGQDPTPKPGMATGLAFSVANPLIVPTVLNVLLQLALEGFHVDVNNGDLTSWATQGVLLLNRALTIRQGETDSHKAWWEVFSEYLIQHISKNAQPSVWLLLGNEAKKYKGFIDTDKHYVIEGGHPSPIGGRENTFIGGQYFRCANNFLIGKGRLPVINWGWGTANSLRACPDEPKPAIVGEGPSKKPRRFK